MAETLNISNFIHLNAINKNSKIPLVLIHGWGLNSAVWQPFIDNLSDDFLEKFNVITIDLPGFGLNIDKRITPYSLQNICQSISKTMTEPAIYLGWSLGGLVATEMALSYPEKVLGLITVASSPRFLEKYENTIDERIDNKNSQVQWPGINPQVLKNFHQQLQVDTKKTINGFLKIQAMGSPHIRQDIKKITALVFQHDMASETTLEQSLKLLEASDFRKKLQDISIPFLRLYGASDSLVPKAVIEHINKLAPQSDYHVFQQASHVPFISHGDDFKEILLNWLQTKSENDF